MGNLGVTAGDSRDDLGQKRFFPYPPEKHIIPGETLRIAKTTYSQLKEQEKLKGSIDSK